MMHHAGAAPILALIVTRGEQTLLAGYFYARNHAWREWILNAYAPGAPESIASGHQVAASINDVVLDSVAVQILTHQSNRVTLGDSAQVELQMRIAAGGDVTVDLQIRHSWNITFD